jgi:acetolactate synthase-1/2/3 large subunit
VTNITPSEITRETRRLTGSQIIWDSLVNQGVRVVFGYPGGAIMPAYDALPQYPDLRHILVRHEQGAAHMADGYARASGDVGVAVATSGPGATNLVTGIANAMMDSIPIVCVTGQVPSSLIGSDAFQEVDITGITLPITKHNFLVNRAEDIMPTLRQAFYIASSGRPGPVLVDITKDAQNQTVDYRYEATPVLPGYRPERQPIPEDIERALEMIKQSKRPIVFCGHGVVKANATSLLLELVRRTNIPVALTLLGLGGFPASHARSLGMMGMHGEAWVNNAIQEADLIIALGMRFDDRVTGNLKTYAPHAKKIHVELDPAEINKNVKVDLPLLGDLREILRVLVPNVEAPSIDEWIERIETSKGDTAVRDIREMPDSGRLFAAHVIHDLWRFTEGKALVVTDVGQHQMWEAQYYKHDHPRKLLTSGGLGTMGFALPAAMGARMACPNDEVWVIAGDGGFQMTACELSTCAQEDIKVNVAVINNGYLGMVRQWQQFFYGGRYVATPIKSPDFVKLAEAHDLMGLRVTKRDEVRAAVEAARASSKTTVIDFRVEQEDSVYPMVPAGADLHAMIRRPLPEGQKNPIFETGED